jgi:hypothetical protein
MNNFSIINRLNKLLDEEFTLRGIFGFIKRGPGGFLQPFRGNDGAIFNSHGESSEAIQCRVNLKLRAGLLRCARNDGDGLLGYSNTNAFQVTLTAARAVFDLAD